MASPERSQMRPGPDRISFLTTAGPALQPRFRNRNLAQRLLLVPERYEFEMTVPRGSKIDLELPANVVVRMPARPGMRGFLDEAWRLIRAARHDPRRVVITDRSIVSALPALLRGREFTWIVDLWDSPHKEAIDPTWSARGSRGALRSALTRAKNGLLRRTIRHADAVLASVDRAALTEYRILEERLIELGNAVFVEELTSREPADRAPQTICYVASQFPRDRGVPELVTAFEQIAPRHPAARLKIAGILPAEIERSVKSSAASSRIELLGPLSLEESLSLIERSQIGVAPFRDNEDLAYTYPVKVIEYMLLGAVVVASDLPGMRRMLGDGRCGVLAAPGSVEGLADALESVLADPAIAERLRAAARAAAPSFDAHAKSDRIYAAIEGAHERRAYSQTAG